MSVSSTAHDDSVWREVRHFLSFRNISAIYIWIAMVILFAMFQWQWLKNHPAKFDVAGILDV